MPAGDLGEQMRAGTSDRTQREPFPEKVHHWQRGSWPGPAQSSSPHDAARSMNDTKQPAQLATSYSALWVVPLATIAFLAAMGILVLRSAQSPTKSIQTSMALELTFITAALEFYVTYRLRRLPQARWITSSGILVAACGTALSVVAYYIGATDVGSALVTLGAFAVLAILFATFLYRGSRARPAGFKEASASSLAVAQPVTERGKVSWMVAGIAVISLDVLGIGVVVFTVFSAGNGGLGLQIATALGAVGALLLFNSLFAQRALRHIRKRHR